MSQTIALNIEEVSLNVTTPAESTIEGTLQVTKEQEGYSSTKTTLSITVKIQPPAQNSVSGTISSTPLPALSAHRSINPLLLPLLLSEALN